MRILLFSEVTLFKYNVSTILSPIVACSEGIFLGGEHALSILREFFAWSHHLGLSMTRETGAVHFRSSVRSSGLLWSNFRGCHVPSCLSFLRRWRAGLDGKEESGGERLLLFSLSITPCSRYRACHQDDWRGSSQLLRPAEITEQDNVKNDSKQI